MSSNQLLYRRRVDTRRVVRSGTERLSCFGGQLAIHAFAISSVVNGTAVVTVAGSFYLAGIEQASDLRRALRELNASIRDSPR
jgi:hypothetical protein